MLDHISYRKPGAQSVIILGSTGLKWVMKILEKYQSIGSWIWTFEGGSKGFLAARASNLHTP